MVLTQLQLKWPNHSTQLLSGLKYLLKNEQLVDCTLKCNKHTLKVHRSVLAACSPYFERELENNPHIVVKDMQFNVLQALIEFMYYGETRITEENLSSLIEAAKLFQIKGLSEMDLMSSNENSIVPPAVSVNKNCTVESSFVPENMNDVFDSNLQTMDSTLKSPVDEAISANVPNQCLSDGDDSNSTLMGESTTSQTHSNRNFVITPPQTESAQILLSLAACSYSQKQYLNPGPPNEGAVAEEMQNGGGGGAGHHNLHGNLLFGEPSFMLPEPITSSSSSEPHSMAVDSSAPPHSSLQHASMVTADSLTAGAIVGFIDADKGPKQNAEPQGAQSASVDCTESLLAKLLTRDNQNCARKSAHSQVIGGARYENLYDVEPAISRADESKNAPRVAASTAFSRGAPMQAAAALATVCGVDLPPGILVDCPFLIETNTGYVDLAVDNMLNTFENDIFTAHSKNTVKIIPKEEVQPLEEAAATRSASAVAVDAAVSLLPPLHVDEQPASDAVLERIRQDTADELRDDPEAVALTRVADDGRLETFVLSSADVRALRQANEQRRKRRQQEGGAAPVALHRDFESPLGSCGGDAPVSLITRVVQFDAAVDDAISKLPFRKSSRPPSSLSADSGGAVAPNCAAGHDALLAEAAFDEHRRAHSHHHHPHHENMFEELDSQFNMDCSIEHMQRDYVAYEEASKNETQLEHNYYSNALKDADEECVAMLLEQPLTNGNGLADKRKSDAASYHRHIIGATDVYLNNVVVAAAGEKKEPVIGSRRNGLVAATAAAGVSSTTAADGVGGDKSLLNGNADLILNKDALMSSVMAPTPGTRLANGTSKNGAAPTVKSRAVGRGGAAAVASSSGEFGVNTLPFKSVKNASSEKKPRRTYKRKAAAEAAPRSTTSARRRKESASENGGLAFVDSHLVEEIVVDEIS